MATRVIFGKNAHGKGSEHDPSSTALAKAREAFEAHLEAQGATMDDFLERVQEVTSAARVTLHAESAGMLELDLARLRDVIVGAQPGSAHGDYRDLVGIRLLVRPGNPVMVGEPIATVRCASELNVDELISRIRCAFGTRPPSDGEKSAASEEMEEIHA